MRQTLRVWRLMAPDRAETLRTNPEGAIALAEELHAVDLAAVKLGLPDEPAVVLVATLPVSQSAGAFDVMEPDRRVQLFEKV